MIDAHHGWNKSFKPLISGFLLSLILTLAAYFIVSGDYFSGANLLFIILGLSSLQAVVQFVFFFHLGLESKPRWNLIHFLFMVLVIIVVIGGSLWIMYNLNYQMMPNMKM